MLKKSKILPIILIIAALTAVTPVLAKSGNSYNRGFTQGIVVPIDGEDYYLAGPPIGPNGENDVPGHYWVQAGPRGLIGKHYNEGPFGMPSWWSSDAPDGALLFIVIGRINSWSPEIAEKMVDRGYVHYHEFIRVSDGALHPTKVLWLKHIAVRSFTLDGGPNPGAGVHYVTPGVDYDFLNNWMNPYNP
ncbi:MAG: hypothetical protein ACXAC6_11105 [Candidatus Hodarchaeales archaeon]